MISKDNFVKMIRMLEKDEEYKTKLNAITQEYNQENSFCFTNNDFAKAFDILLRESLDNTEWMYDCVWSYILEGREIKFFVPTKKGGKNDKEIICDTPEKLYDFFISE